ncbi:flavin reductase family protein [Streptomyces sp. NPDC050161]|uniref:flavin reductase family protein n=1 Tax=Streptomyces sp. NPDC050161 TaxID=3365604 RepID=UPI00378C4092
MARPDADLYRQSVALFATGIVVVTADDTGGQPHGATVNSFTSISLDPPTVMISLKRGRTHGLISASGWYGVSVLAREQRDYATHFSGRRNPSCEPVFLPGDRVSTLDGSLARFECEVTREVEVHDHTLFVARVHSHTPATKGSPLVFFDSRHNHDLHLG